MHCRLTRFLPLIFNRSCVNNRSWLDYLSNTTAVVETRISHILSQNKYNIRIKFTIYVLCSSTINLHFKVSFTLNEIKSDCECQLSQWYLTVSRSIYTKRQRWRLEGIHWLQLPHAHQPPTSLSMLAPTLMKTINGNVEADLWCERNLITDYT